MYEKYSKHACRAARAHMIEQEKRVQGARDEASKVMLRKLFNIRARLAKQGGLYALHRFVASVAYDGSTKATTAECWRLSWRLLGGLVSGRRKRAMATRFVRGKGAAATISAVIDAASSEARANGGEDMGTG